MQPGRGINERPPFEVGIQLVVRCWLDLHMTRAVSDLDDPRVIHRTRRTSEVRLYVLRRHISCKHRLDQGILPPFERLTSLARDHASTSPFLIHPSAKSESLIHPANATRPVYQS